MDVITDQQDTIALEKLPGVDFFPNSSYENESVCRDLIDFCATEPFNKERKTNHLVYIGA